MGIYFSKDYMVSRPKFFNFLFAIIMLISVPSVTSAAIVKCVDSNGNITYAVDSCPDGYRVVKSCSEDAAIELSLPKNDPAEKATDKTTAPIKVNGNANIFGYVIWKYNDFIGKKADVGAKVWLFRKFDDGNHYLDPHIFDRDSSLKEKGVYFTTVDLQGKYRISNLPSGIYDMLIVSAATRRNILIKFDPSIDYMAEHKRFMQSYRNSHDAAKGLQFLDRAIAHLNYYHFKEDILKPRFKYQDYKTAALLAIGLNKYEIKFALKLEEGCSIEINKDFGLTYY